MALQYGLNNAVDFEASKIMMFASVYSRTMGQPMDKTELWYPLEVTTDGGTTIKTGLERAQEYAASSSAYVGQTIAVVDVLDEKITLSDGSEVNKTKVTFYGIQDAIGTLKELGSAPLGDEASITIGLNGKISLFGYEGAEKGLIPFKGENGLEWKSIASVVAGVSVTGQNGIKVTESEDEETGKAIFTIEADISDDETNALELKDGKLYVPTVEVPEVKHPEYAIKKLEEPTEGSQATYRLTKDGENVDVAIEIPKLPEIPEQTDYTVTVETEGPEDSALKHYVFYQRGVSEDPIVHIDIPKDLVVESGSVITATVEDVTDTNGVVIGETYIKLVIAHQEEPIYIAAKDLVEIYKVDNTDKTVELTVAEDGVTLSADVKISAEAGNPLVAKDDGLYVNAPTLPTVKDEKETGKVVVAVSQTDGKIAVTKEQLSYNDLADKPEIPTVPDLNLGQTEELEATMDATIAVIAQLGVNEHTITPKTIEVASKKGLEDLAAIVGTRADDEGAVASGIFADIAALGLELDSATTADKLSYTYADGQWSAATKTPVDIATILVEAHVVQDDQGVPISGTAGLMTPAEKYKLSALEIGDSGNIEISGSVNADKVIGLDAKVIGIVTGEADGQLGIEEGAQVNLIEHLALQTGASATDYLDIDITNKRVVLPLATATSIGLVQSGTGNNQVSYANGVGTVAHVSTDTLVQGTNELILNGGNASGATATV